MPAGTEVGGAAEGAEGGSGGARISGVCVVCVGVGFGDPT